MDKVYIGAAMLLLACAACTERGDKAKFVNEPRSVTLADFTSADRAFADVRGDAIVCKTVTTDLEESGDSLVPAHDALVSTQTLIFDQAGHISRVRRDDTYMLQPVDKSVFEFEFDSIGTLLTSATDLGGHFQVTRDGNGYVTTFTSISSQGDEDYKQLYTWTGGRLTRQQLVQDHHPVDRDGNPIPQPKDVAEYVYDKNGYLVSQTEESGDPQLQINMTTIKYRYNDRDSLGNWTSRNVTRTAKVYEVRGGRRVLTDSISTFQIEERTICY